MKRINHKAGESHMIDGVELERVFIKKDVVMKKLYQFMEVRASFHSFPFVYDSRIRLKDRYYPRENGFLTRLLFGTRKRSG